MSDAFVRSALVGLGRDPNATPVSGTPVDALVTGELPRERAFLLRAGARDVYVRAGSIPPKGAADFEPAAAETLGTCSPQLANALADALDDQHLLRVAANALREARLAIPHRLLPEILAIADRHTRAALAPVVGERGRWLARLNSAWSWAVDAVAELDRWEEGTIEQRVEALRAMRSTDAAAARQRLSEVWAKERAEQRIALIEALATGLSLDDEPFLEKALDDRSVNVKAAAADLLARLPGSAFAVRMQARADAALRLPAPEEKSIWSKVKSIGKSGAKLVVDPPAELDPAATRDIIPSRTPQGTGARAFALTEIIGAVPPEVWTKRFSMTPEQLLGAAAGTDWSAALIEGWLLATIRHRHAEWARALVTLVTRKEAVLTTEQKIELARALPAGDLVALVHSISGDAWPLRPLLELIPHPWPEAFGREWLLRMRRLARRGGDTEQSYLIASTAELTARAIPPSLFDEATAGWEIAEEPWHRGNWERATFKLAQTIRIRKLIAEETRS